MRVVKVVDQPDGQEAFVNETILECRGSSTANTNASSECRFRYVSPYAQIFLKNCTMTTGADGKPWNPSTCDLPDDQCVDTHIADSAVELLAILSASVKVAQMKMSARKHEHPPQNDAEQQAFFFATGFHKPHPFWAVPQRFQDMYSASGEKALPLPLHQSAPAGAPNVSFYSCASINGR